MSFKSPSFQERTALAAKTKQAALAKYLAKPPIDPAVLAAQIEAEAARAAARQQAKAEKLAARAAEKAAKDQARAEAAAARAPVPPKSEEEQKQIRDAKYAARKMRLGKR